jgi:hypothetical protein
MIRPLFFLRFHGSNSRAFQPTNWDHWYCGAALSAIAASKGFASFAEAVLELDPDTIDDMLRRKFGE